MSKPRIVARCGDAQNAPESTLPAFASAIAKGADALEFDVHMSKDGELVVHHDFYLGRTDSGTGFIGDYTLAELKTLDAGRWFDPRFSGVQIPTLQEVLDLGRGKVSFEIDMKGSSLSFLARLIQKITQLDVVDAVELTSAHIPLLFHVKRLNPTLRTGVFHYSLPEWMKPALGHRHILDWMSLADAQVAHLHSSLIDPYFVETLQRAGLVVHGSNLDTAEEIAMALAAQVDQISTSKLDLALQLARPGTG